MNYLNTHSTYITEKTADRLEMVCYDSVVKSQRASHHFHLTNPEGISLCIYDRLCLRVCLYLASGTSNSQHVRMN